MYMQMNEWESIEDWNWKMINEQGKSQGFDSCDQPSNFA